MGNSTKKSSFGVTIHSMSNPKNSMYWFPTQKADASLPTEISNQMPPTSHQLRQVFSWVPMASTAGSAMLDLRVKRTCSSMWTRLLCVKHVANAYTPKKKTGDGRWWKIYGFRVDQKNHRLECLFLSINQFWGFPVLTHIRILPQMFLYETHLISEVWTILVILGFMHVHTSDVWKRCYMSTKLGHKALKVWSNLHEVLPGLVL